MINDSQVNESPIRDFFFQLMMLEYDLSEEEMINSLYSTIHYMLEQMDVGTDPMEYLDFNIKKKDMNYLKVIANNIVTALWFTGIIPLNPDSVYENNEMRYNGKLYKFNNKTKKLTWKIIKE